MALSEEEQKFYQAGFLHGFTRDVDKKSKGEISLVDGESYLLADSFANTRLTIMYNKGMAAGNFAQRTCIVDTSTRLSPGQNARRLMFLRSNSPGSA